MTKRPRVHLNCASSLDGRLAGTGGAPIRFSDPVDLRRVHGLRAACDAILVGVGTVLADDPLLRVKQQYASGSDPLRVVLDTRGRTPSDARVVDGAVATLVLHGPGVDASWRDAESVEMPLDAAGRLDLKAVLGVLETRGVRSVLVEGGPTVLRSFLEAGLVDVFTLYQAPVLVGDGPALWPGAPGETPRKLHVDRVERQGAGALWTLHP